MKQILAGIQMGLKALRMDLALLPKDQYVVRRGKGGSLVRVGPYVILLNGKVTKTQVFMVSRNEAPPKAKPHLLPAPPSEDPPERPLPPDKEPYSSGGKPSRPKIKNRGGVSVDWG